MSGCNDIWSKMGDNFYIYVLNYIILLHKLIKCSVLSQTECLKDLSPMILIQLVPHSSLLAEEDGTAYFLYKSNFKAFIILLRFTMHLKSKCISSFHCCCFFAGSLTAASFVTWFRCYLTNLSLIWAPAVCSLSSSGPLTPANQTIIHWPSPPPLWWETTKTLTLES